MARLIARDMARGMPTISIAQAGAVLAEEGGIPDLVACLMVETGKKRPADPVIEVYCHLLEAALTHLRIASHGGKAHARTDLAAARAVVEAAVISRKLAPFTVMLIARAFTEAGLEAGPALEQAMSLALEDDLPMVPTPTPDAKMAAHLAPLAEALRHDPFAIHAEFVATGAAFSTGHRAAMAATLAGSTIPGLREAALGFLLERNPASGKAVLEALQAEAPRNPVPSRLVERLVCLRPWLPPARQPMLDQTIRVLRLHATPSAAAPRIEVTRLLASLCDGAGAQSLFALLRRERRYALASVLMKAGEGVTEAWVQGDLSKRQAEGILPEIISATEAVPVPVSFVALRIADALAINLARQAPPPFGLLQVTEALGLGLVQPAAMPPGALTGRLLAEQPPERTGPEATEAAHARSAEWPKLFGVLSSWFEVGEAVDALLRPIRLRPARIEAVRTRLLPARRGFWAERAAWMAATLHGSAAPGDEAWLDFALVARDLAGEEPLPASPLLEIIAEATVDAFAANERPRRPVPRKGR
jgi:hypothetical protein